MRLALVPALALVACSTAADPISFADYEAALAQAQCQAIFACCDQQRIDETKGQYTDVPSCVQHNAVPTDSISSAYRFDPVAAGACLQQMKSDLASCNETVLLSTGFGQCPEAFVGTIALGASCALPEGAYNFGDPCVAGAVCNDLGDGTTPLCVAAAEKGASCATTPCDTGLRCGTDMLCAAPLPNGSACDNDNDACDSVNCANNVCTDPGPTAWICYYDPS